MKLAMYLAALLWLAPVASAADRAIAAGSWSGYLVDSKCYQNEEDNRNPWDTNPDVSRDKDLELRLCPPNAKTKSFALVQRNWVSLKFDSAGNEKAAELVRKVGKKAVFPVTVAGETDAKKKTIFNVASISLAP
jgi:hypothetical protein